MPAGFYSPSSTPEPIVGIQICVFSPEEIERRSVVEITSQGTYEGNEPKIGGLFDPRMGVLDNGKTCRSCGQSNHNCPGHFGHYRLARPVYFIQFLPFVLNVLSCVCVRCSKLLIDKKQHTGLLKRRGEARWREVLASCKEINRCGQETEDGCGARQPNRYVREGIARIVAEWDNVEGPAAEGSMAVATPSKQRQPLEVEYVLRLFRRVTDEDVDFLGLNRFWCRPDWMICSVLPIPPPQVRPSVTQDNNQRSEDDLTHKLADIIKTNITLQQRIESGGDKKIVDEWTNVLQYHIATLVDNQIPGVAPSAQRNGRPLKSIQQRLGSKEGRIRYNIQGKRVEFSARSVITPDPNISIAELGVPEKIAMNLTRPERVTPYNRDQLYKLVQNGPMRYPGAKTIVRRDGRMISLRHVNTKDLVLHYGDIVNRHLMDGDMVLFNRQPTLHRMSMMGHRVKVLKYKTFRLNVSVTAPYNADFDGDEMNAHIPQSYEASTELEEIAAVPHQILRPRDGKPVIGIVQDTLVGSFRLTRESVRFNRREFMNLMMWNKRFDGTIPAAKGERGDWTGHQVMSMLLPPINMDMDNSAKGRVIIREGDVVQGQFDKDIFSKASKGVIHVTFKDYGPQTTVNLIDSLQNTVEQFLVYNGFSVGISDLIADQKTKAEMDRKIQEKKVEIENLLLTIHQDLFVNNTGKTNQEEFENKVFGALNKATELAGETGHNSLANENRMTAMIRAGSKGGVINIAQMMACVGQQSIEGKRIPYGFSDRTLPHYKKYDDSAEARGFIESSFIHGLTPQQFFFHAMSGREGLIDTAVKTADTGYIQRQLVKAMEDLVVQNDGSVRDANMNITQFHYGEDGVNSSKVESQPLPLGKYSHAKLRAEFGLEGVDLSTVLADGVVRGDDAAALDAYVTKMLAEQKQLVEGVYRFGRQSPVFAPVNIERILTSCKIQFGLNPQHRTNLTPAYVLAGIERVIQKTQPFNKMWSALLHYHLAPHTLIVKERFTESAFDALCELLVLKNWQAWVQPGEQVGILAAQSIGEPSTQMSCSSHTFVVAHTKTKSYAGPIGELIDSLLKADARNVITIGEDSVVLDLKEDIMIVGVSNDEKTSWRRISQVSRHPANGGLVEVHTRTGRKTTATLTHSFLKRSPAGIVPVLGSELRVGMRVPVAKTIQEVPSPTQFVVQGATRFVLDRDLGWLCGIYLADGCLNGNSVSISKVAPIVEERLVAFCALYKMEFETRNHIGAFGPSKDNIIKSKDLKDFLLETFKQGSYTKVVGPLVYHAPLEFIQGLVGGFFDGDGNINVDRQMIRASSRSRPLLEGINRLLGYCSMFGILGEETSIRIPDKIQYTLNIPKKFAKLYEETIGFSLPEKATALHEIVRYNDRDEIHDHKEIIDKIPELGPVIAKTGKLLRMPGQSRTYGRWLKKESIGRRTLEEYVENFKEMLKIHVDPLVESEVRENIATMESALAADVFWDEIVDLVYLDDPKTYVYDFTVPGNDSFMVDDNILVHNTLNSVDWDTQIVISKNGAIVTPQIGEFIDDYYTNCSEETKIQRLPNDQIYIPLDDGNDWKAMSTDAHGNVTWTKLEAITRHPVVNEDGSNTILRVTLDSGRVVKATKGKSFLTMVDGLLTPTNGSELKVGDALPILNDLALPESMIVDTLSLRDVLPATDNEPRDQLPQATPLTQSFGFFVGAYLAEEISNNDHICVTNNDTGYLNCVKGLMEEWGIKTELVEGTTTSLIIHSTLLAKVMSSLFGRVSYEKTMPDWVLQAPDAFVSGLVDGYFCGDRTSEASEDTIPLSSAGRSDGTVEAKTGCVRATSCSKDLLLRMGALLARYGIFATYSERMPEQGNFQSVSISYTMTLLAKYSQRFAKQFTLSIAAKQERLDAHFGGGDEEVERQCRRASTNGVVWDTIQSIEEIAPMGEGWVYDLTVEGTRNFTSLDLVGHRDTFHLAGVASKSNVTRGVPRLKELLKVTHNPKATSLTIALKPEYRNSKEKAREVTQDLELTLLRDMTVRVAIYFDPKDSNTVVEEDKELIAFYKQFEQVLEQEQGGAAADPWSKWVLRLELDRQRMFDKNITMDDLMFILRQKYGDEIHTIYSDFNSQKLVMRIRIPEKFNTDELSSMDGLNDYKKFQNRLLNSILIRGVPGIKAVTFRKGEDRYQLEDGEYKTIQEYILDTDGSNFLEVMNHPAVDGTRLYSTHVHDVLPYLGVEAARAVLLNEMNTLFEEAGINYRHLGLLCDVMTRAGRFMSIDRYGINKMDIGPLAKASFEETERMLLRAAVFGEMDPITGVSANIMTGQPIRGGTSFSSILLDEAALLRVQKGLPAVVPLEGDEEGPTQEEVEKALYQETTDACATTSLRMNMTMPTATTFVEEPDIELQVLDIPAAK